MSEPHPSEDKAAQYLLGGLTDAERRAFEAELANSAELRALLRELEESSVLLAMASPQRRPPAKVWQSIEKAVADDAKATEPIPAFWTRQARHGWAAAATILLGWLLYAVWINHRDTADVSQSGVVSEARSSDQLKPVPGRPTESRENQPSNKKNDVPRIAAADSPELLRLRRQVTELQNRVTNLSQAVAQQQALLGESNRIKFFQISSATGGNSTTPVPSLSPALQRAMFLAMARELGWLSPADSPFSGTNTAFLPGGNVDFVDLRPAANGTPKIVPPQPNTQAANQSPSEPSPTPNATLIAIPAFTSGNNVVVAIDQSIVPTGTQVNFLDQNQQPIGWTTVGDNPVVVTIPTSLGGSLFITTGGFSAPLNTWQISAPVSANP
jgi:hypothetical protein